MKKVLGNAALMLASVFFFLLLLESALRLLDGVPLLKFENFVAYRISDVTTRSNNKYDPDLGWIPQEFYPPGSSAPDIGRYGVWLKPGDPVTPPQGAILAVGDSFTVGSEVSQDQSWPAQLERMLGEPVLNAAAGGYGVDQIVLRVESLLDSLKPRLVVMAYLVDDIARNGFSSYGAPKPYFQVRDGTLVRLNNPVPTYKEYSNLGPILSVAGYLYAVDWTLRRLGLTALEYGLKFRAVDTNVGAVSCLLIERLKSELAARNVPLLVVTQYGGLGTVQNSALTGFPSFVLEVGDCIEAARVPHVDLWDDFRRLLAEGIEKFKPLWMIHPGMIEGGDRLGGWYFGHPSSAGHELTARRIAERLRQLGWAHPQQAKQ